MDLIDIQQAARVLSAPVARARRLLKALPVIDYGKGRGCGKRWARTDVEDLARSLLKHEDEHLQSRLRTRQPCSLGALSVDDLYRLTQAQTLQ